MAQYNTKISLTLEGLKLILMDLNNEYVKIGLAINLSKTKAMCDNYVEININNVII